VPYKKKYPEYGKHWRKIELLLTGMMSRRVGGDEQEGGISNPDNG
jgi:hypothetical protein